MKKILKIALVIVFLAGMAGAWVLFGSATGFSEAKAYLYIRTTAATREAVLDSLEANNIVTNRAAFSFVADRLNYWQAIKPGKYEIKKDDGLLGIVRMLRNGRQVPVNLVITKFRTSEDFARFTGARFEFDSSDMLSFLQNPDSLQRYEATPETAFWRILPDKYQYFWNSTPATVYRKLYNESREFWNEERTAKAKALGLSPAEVYTLASIIEEETTNHAEKDTIASVYLNRLRIGMPLQADPTLKFATRNFALKRIAGDILQVASPYNTYRNKGLPPGPICTPSKITINAVLNAAETPFLYFVANRGLSGHLFSKTFEEHVQKAAEYRRQDKARRNADSLRSGNGL